MVYKILVFSIPGIGHTNPMIKICNELIKTYNAKVIIFSVKNFQSHIESIGAEFRSLEDLTYEQVMERIKFNDDNYQLIKSMINAFSEDVERHAVKISNIIESEKPDLVLYDAFAILTKFSVEILKTRYPKKLPILIAYSTMFVSQDGIYPNEVERKVSFKLTKFEITRLLLSLVWQEFAFRRQFRRLGITFPGLKALFQKDPSVLHLVLTFPELHPRSHLFDDKNTKFVGACISDDIHVAASQKHDNSVIDQMLERFPIINPPHRYTKVSQDDENNETATSAKKLIYVSLGTIFNTNTRIYSILIDAFKTIEQGIDNESRSVKLNDLCIVFSLGQTVFSHFQQEIVTKSLTLPENILLLPSAPQLDILKRASLFITHCGMNSTSESVHYGVPMICLPINGDQPGNAYRVATELGLGIEFDFRVLTSMDIKKALHKILSDSSYYKRCNLYSQLSSEYVGHKNVADIVMREIEKQANNDI